MALGWGFEKATHVMLLNRPARSLPCRLLPLLFVVLILSGCGGIPLEVQQRHIRDNDLQLRVLTSEAFLATWGAPTYQYEGLVHFYPVDDGQYVPSFLVPTGEAPENWDSTVLSGVGLFFVYAEQGQLLGFLDNRLVFRGPLPAADVHALGKAWAKEMKFRTRTEAEYLQRR
jgi:hypothetical protein